MLVLFCVSNSVLFAQNEYAKWYFGYNAGLDFLTNTPTVLNNSALISPNSCASMADGNGNLLFYTNGVVIKNSLHLNMANGTGLHSNQGLQNVIAVRQPGSTNFYYVFTIGDPINVFTLKYSVVDMSLAAGQGSVIAKNIVVAPQACTQKLTGTYHCNGKDIWIVSHDLGNNTFRAYLLTSAGLNTVAVVSSVGFNHVVAVDGPMRISPSGKKLGATIGSSSATFRAVELMDFNSTTGVISNPITVLSETLLGGSTFMGIEFSPDNSKLYVSGNSGNQIHQWDICAGSPTAIIASHYIIPTSTPLVQGLQLAQNGKIYGCSNGGPISNSLHVIGSPNNAGSACNFYLLWANSRK